MALSHTAKKRWSLVILLVGMPVYVILAVSIMSVLDRPPLWVEFLIYAALGVLWAVPFRAVFQGVGQEDPVKR
jgi:Protein of unknown function (DUF2842).